MVEKVIPSGEREAGNEQEDTLQLCSLVKTGGDWESSTHLWSSDSLRYADIFGSVGGFEEYLLL